MVTKKVETPVAAEAPATPVYNGPIFILKSKFAKYLPGHKLLLQDGKYFLEWTSIYFSEQEIKDEALFEELPVNFAGLTGDKSLLGTFSSDNIVLGRKVIIYSLAESKWIETKFEGNKGTSFIALFAIGAVLPLDATTAEKTKRMNFIKQLAA